jgi:hypothetical protein
MTGFSGRLLAVCALSVTIGATGCSDLKLGGTIDVNGKSSAVSTCRTGKHADGNSYGEAVSDAGYRVRMVKTPTAGSSAYTLVLYGPEIASGGLTMACSGNVSTGWREFGSGISGSYAGTCRAGTFTVVSNFSFGGCKQGTS